MPTITVNRKVFEKLVGKKLNEEQLKDRISMLGTDLESVDKEEIKVEIFPNRPDLLSVQGFARAFSSFIGVNTGLKDYKIKKSGKKIIIKNSVKQVRPYTACAIIKGIKIDDERIKEMIDIQEKLHITFGRNRKKLAIGIYPMEVIKFPVTYSAEKPEDIVFKALGLNQRLTARQILSKHPTGREYGNLLEGFDLYPVFKDARGEVLSLPPVINSEETGKVTEQTKELFVECSGFDFETLNKCLNIVVTALADMGGEIYSLDLEYDSKYSKNKLVTPNLTPKKMKFDLNYINKILGLELKEKDAKKCLEKMGFGYEKGQVLIPAYRTDILHQIDFSEDIAIAYGYENFESIIPKVATIGSENQLDKFMNKIRDILIGLKLIEVKNYHLMRTGQLNELMLLENKGIELKNSLGEHNTLRSSLTSSLMKNLSENQHNEYPQNIFELGKVFSLDKTKKIDTGIKETEKLSVSLCHEKVDFTEIKQALDALMSSLGLQYEVKESEHIPFIEGRVGEILVNGKLVGIIGELHPQVLQNWNLTVPVSLFELDVEKLFEDIKC